MKKHKPAPIKRLIVLLISFALASILNLFLLTNFWHTTRVQLAQQKILAEIELIDSIQGDGLEGDTIRSHVKLIDSRSAKLRRYLRSRNSPLFDYTDLLVEEADKHHYDYRLLVAIALQESSGCKIIPENSYNCWGWGIYGNKITRFNSYEEAIRTVSRGIKRGYIDKGLVTTEQIMSKYTPSSNGSWSRAVTWFFHRIDTF